MSDFAYMFPEIKSKKVKPAIPVQQLHKIREEVEEVENIAYGWSVASLEFEPGYGEALLMEVFDTIHACETFLRMVIKPEDAKRIRDLVIEKNEKRGYYAED